MRLQVLLFSAVAVNVATVLAAPHRRQTLSDVPEACTEVCSSLESAITQCTENPEGGAACLCTQSILSDTQDCLQCSADNAEAGQDGAVDTAQSTLDEYVQQCESLSVTLTPAPITSADETATESLALTTTGSDILTESETESSTMEETMSMPTSTPAPTSTSGPVVTVPTTTRPTSAVAASGTPTTRASGATGKPYGGMAAVGGGVLAFALTVFTLL